MAEETKARIRISKKDIDENLLGPTLADLRISVNLSQEEVGKKMKTNQPFISRMEGQRGISLKTLVSFLDAIGFNLILEEK